MREDDKQRRPQPPQRGHPLNPGRTLPAPISLEMHVLCRTGIDYQRPHSSYPACRGMLGSVAIPYIIQAPAPVCQLQGPALPSGLCPLHPVPGVFVPTPLILIGVLTDGSHFPTCGLLPAAPPAPAQVPRLGSTAGAISLRSSHFTDVETEPCSGQGACVGCTE